MSLHPPFLFRSHRLAAALLALIGGVPPAPAMELPPAYAIPAGDAATSGKIYRSRDEVIAAGREVIERYADKALAATGYLDVTKAPYLARGDGKTDDTAALQRALRDARDARLVVWLPAGTYLVSDTLHCVQGAIDWRPSPDTPASVDAASVNEFAGAEDRLSAMEYPCVVEGPTGSDRAVIRLAPAARNFDDPARPRPVFYLWARRWTAPHDHQPAVSFNQMLTSVDFDVRGHAGAIAVDHQAAQGSVIQDVNIEAEGAFAGLRGLIGSGGSIHGLAVRGGRFGILAAGIGEHARLAGSQPGPLLVEATLTGQTETAVYYTGRGPLTIIGARIGGRGIVCAAVDADYNGALNLLDSSIDVAAGDAISANRPVYMANTFVRGAASVVRFSDGRSQAAAGEGWTQVREFAGAPEGPFPIWIDGRRRTEFVADLEHAAGIPEDLQSRHALPTLPAWNAAGVVDARAAYGVKGDDQADDAPAIQRAIDENKTVFLPKGRYRLGRPLVLPAGHTLFGVSRTLTVLAPGRTAAAYADDTAAQPLLETADTPTGETTLARLELQVTRAGAYAVRWRAGARSVVSDVNFHRKGVAEARAPNVLIEGSGGGRWFNFTQDEQTHGPPEYRHLLVRGTRQPLTFYMFNIEHARGDVMAEFTDVRNVTLYALKGETYEIGNAASGTRPLVQVTDSKNFRIFGAAGICGASPGYPPHVYGFENCHDVLVTNVAHQSARRFADPKTWSMISDHIDGRSIETPATEFPVLYRRD